MCLSWIRIGALFAALVPLDAQPVSLTVSRLFTDKAVLQRDEVVPIWGTATPGTMVTVTFGPLRRSAVTDSGGRWRVDLPPQSAASAGRDLAVKTSDGQGKIISDVLVGDLWYCAGQSNMELGMGAIPDHAREMKDLNYPGLRLYLIPKSASGTPRSDPFGVWMGSNRVNVTSGGWSGFSAVAYTFGRKLHRELGVPVGLIQAAYGGSPISAWIPPEQLTGPEYAGYRAQMAGADEEYKKARASDPQVHHRFDDPPETTSLGPSSIFHAMVEPLGPLAVKGVLWYQGETDVGDGPLYTKKMNSLITGLRRFFGRPTLPFYFAQIAPWEGYGSDSLPRLWAAQKAVLATLGTGMVSTIDVGDFGDIHPLNKRPVGERFALQALAKTYRRAVKADGPVFLGWKAQGEGAVVSFTSSGPLATVDGQSPQSFEVQGTSEGWVLAAARLAGTDVVLTSVAGGKVSAVRYAWSSTPKVNLTDSTGLPARPFSTLQ